MKKLDQIQALRDLEELILIIDEDFGDAAREAILRGLHSSGQRVHKKGEFGEMEGMPGLHHSDPTGEEAIWDERSDRVEKLIVGLARNIRNSLTTAKWICDLSSTDVVERAKRTIPDCMACGDPCIGGVRGGFDWKCYKKWLRTGRPDRNYFIAITKLAKIEQESVTPAVTSGD